MSGLYITFLEFEWVVFWVVFPNK